MTSQATPSVIHRFYPIVGNLEMLRLVLAGGARMLQLRIKEATGEHLLNEIAAAQRLCKEADCLLVVNDYWREAIETGCDYVHLGQEDLDGADLRLLRKKGIRLGISSHDESELSRALAAQPDYIALGPVFPTQSKQLSWAAQGTERVRQWRQKTGTLPLVAIGGISLERAPLVYAAGADSIAVIGDVANHPDPSERCRQWLRLENN